MTRRFQCGPAENSTAIHSGDRAHVSRLVFNRERSVDQCVDRLPTLSRSPGDKSSSMVLRSWFRGITVRRVAARSTTSAIDLLVSRHVRQVRRLVLRQTLRDAADLELISLLSSAPHSHPQHEFVASTLQTRNEANSRRAAQDRRSRGVPCGHVKRPLLSIGYSTSTATQGWKLAPGLHRTPDPPVVNGAGVTSFTKCPQTHRVLRDMSRSGGGSLPAAVRQVPVVPVVARILGLAALPAAVDRLSVAGDVEVPEADDGIHLVPCARERVVRREEESHETRIVASKRISLRAPSGRAGPCPSQANVSASYSLFMRCQ